VKNLVKKRTTTARLSLGLLTLAATLSGLAPASAATLPSLEAEGSNAKSVIVHVKPGQLADVAESLIKRGARIDRSLTAIDSLVITIAAEAQSSVAAMSGVDSVVDDLILQPAGAVPLTSTPLTSVALTAPSTTAPPSTTSPSVVAVDKTAKAKSEKEKLDKDKADKAKSDQEKADKDKSDQEKADKDKSDKDKSDQEKADKDKDKESTDAGSLESIARVTGARDLWKKGITGKGVDVALIDSGIAPVPGAPTIVNGADLSLDAGKANLRFLDGYGHGTHMAGIIAGKDAGVTAPEKAKGAFVGIAPGSRVVNVKVGAMDGSVHTSQVIAGIDWIIQNRSANGMNIRVVNLSYGSPATSNWKLDPLAWAAEVAWNRGILVVAAAGNEGAGHELASPAYSPRILAVGATEVESARGGRGDYAVASFTSSGTRRRPDLYVPGAHVASLRVKNSFVDTFLAKANVSDQLTRASGTSQATAVTSGLAALLFEAFPQANAEQIKALLTGASDKEHGRKDEVTGIETSLDLGDAYKQGLRKLPAVAPIDPLAECGPIICRGIGDGSAPFVNWAQASWNGVTWLMNQWSANQWSANQWSGNQWSANQWSANQWSANQWSANQWSGNQWSANQWSANQWSANQWSSSQWSANQWSANQWSANQWSANQWSSNQWSSSQWSGEAWLSTWAQ
jgi:serine protease AprX